MNPNMDIVFGNLKTIKQLYTEHIRKCEYLVRNPAVQMKFGLRDRAQCA